MPEPREAAGLEVYRLHKVRMLNSSALPSLRSLRFLPIFDQSTVMVEGTLNYAFGSASSFYSALHHTAGAGCPQLIREGFIGADDRYSLPKDVRTVHLLKGPLYSTRQNV